MGLPLVFIPTVEATLVRLGKDNDGGYLIDTKSLHETDCLVSFGLSTDCSFESDFKKAKDLPIIAYDHTINYSIFRRLLRDKFKSMLVKLGKANSQKRLKAFLKLLSKYKLYKKLFFQDDVIHRSIAIGYGHPNSVDIKAVLKHLHTKFNTLTPNAKIFFKIDIEGSEYRILDQLIEIQDRISGLVIEFHDCDLHLQRIVSFIKKFKLPLGHIHGNNYGGVTKEGDPLVLEMTFCLQETPRLSKPWAKSPLDQANNPNHEELELIFQDV